MAAKSAPGALFSLEMAKIAVARRLLSGRSGVETRSLRTGRIDEAQWPALTHGVETLAALPLYISDRTDWTLPKIRARLAQLKTQSGIQFFVLDYMMLLKNVPGKDETEKTANSSLELKSICRDLNLHGVIVHSMNKTGITQAGQEQNGERERPPDMEVLRGSGQVIYDADMICVMSGYNQLAFPEDGVRDNDKPNIRVLWFVKGREIIGRNYARFVKHPSLPRFEEFTHERN
jgi:replicative DNA helicase